MFADDTNLTISGKNYFELQNGTNHDLENTRQWVLANKFEFKHHENRIFDYWL